MYSCNPFWSLNTRLRKCNPSVCCRYLICSLSSTAFCSTYTVVILRTSPFGDCCAVPSSIKCKSCCHTYQPLPGCCCKFSLFYVEMEMEPKRHPGQLLRMAAVPLFWFWEFECVSHYIAICVYCTRMVGSNCWNCPSVAQQHMITTHLRFFSLAYSL